MISEASSFVRHSSERVMTGRKEFWYGLWCLLNLLPTRRKKVCGVPLLELLKINGDDRPQYEFKPHIKRLPYLFLCKERLLSFSAQYSSRPKAMAATLSLLGLPILPQKPLHSHSKLPISYNPTKSCISKDSASNPQPIFHALESASLPLTALTIPYILDPKVITFTPISDFLCFFLFSFLKL